MVRTPDWSLVRAAANPADEKPLVVLELGVCQRVAKAAYIGPWRESMVDRAESWLGGSNVVTNVVVLVDVAEGCETDGLRVLVQVWRRGLVLVQQCEFEVQYGEEVWVAREEGVPEGVIFVAADVGVRGEEVFLLPMWWLRNGVVEAWAACREAVEVGMRTRGR